MTLPQWFSELAPTHRLILRPYSVALKVWSRGQDQQHHLRSCEKGKLSGPSLDTLNQKRCRGWGPGVQAICVLTAIPPPRECDGVSHLRATAWFSVSRALAARGFSCLFIWMPNLSLVLSPWSGHGGTTGNLPVLLGAVHLPRLRTGCHVKELGKYLSSKQTNLPLSACFPPNFPGTGHEQSWKELSHPRESCGPSLLSVGWR